MIRIDNEKGEVTMSKEEYDELLRSKYSHYKLRRAADEMFRAHLGLREYGPHVPAASSKQMVEWQAILSGEDDAE